MSAQSQQSAEEWIQTKCDQLGIDPEDLVHPGDVDHEDAEWLVGAQVLHFEPALDGMRRDDFVVDEIQELETGKGPMMFAVYYYKMGEPHGMNIELTREGLESWRREVRFIPEDVEWETQGAEAAIERIRDMSSLGSLYGDQAEDLARALGGSFDRDDLYDGTISISNFLRRMVGQVTDESPVSASDWYGKSVMGHKKSDRGVYKGNLVALERHFDMEVSYEQ